MLRALKIVIGPTRLFERKDPLDDGVDVMFCQKCIHFLEVVTRAYGNSVNAGIAAADTINIRTPIRAMWAPAPIKLIDRQ